MKRIIQFNTQNVKSLDLYIQLFAQKVETSDQFIDQIVDPNHTFYAAARDVAREILSKTQNWNWLAIRLDDVASEVEKNVAKEIQKWKFRSILGCNKMPLCNPQTTIKWLFERMINEYKNLFDPNRKNFLNIKKSDKIIKILAWEKMQDQDMEAV